jgi:hypothetical protein
MNTDTILRRSRRVAALSLALSFFVPGCFMFQGWKSKDGPAEPAPKPMEAQPSEYEFAEADAPLRHAVEHWNAHQGDELRIDKVALRGDQWRMIRTDAGIITRRDVSISVYSQDPSGQACKISWCSLSQNEEGGSWSDGHLVCERPKPATCESVAKMPVVASIGTAEAEPADAS